jgi:UDP-N-acetylmuramoyl-tripeptide--D-alanyl-D-alanine ligase
MSLLWTRDALVAATQGRASGEWTGITGVSIDTRTIRPGDLFVALSDVRDGHDFVAQALDAGASAALVSHVPDGVAADANLLMVDDPLFALESLGGTARARAVHAKVVAVTGSAGKTSVKDALRAILSPQAATHASERSYNNHWGVPLTLARMPVDTAFGIFEIGMNHSGEIAPLTRMVRPHVAAITNVLPAHLGNFSSVAEIAAAKSEILEGVVPGGHAILNRDNPWFDLLATRAAALDLDTVSFGEHEAASVRMLRLSQQAESASVEADILGEHVLFKLNTAGRHQAINALAVLAAVKLTGADLAKAALSLGRWKPGDGRGARRRIRLDPIDPASAFLLIDESYNANPASVVAALETLSLAEPTTGAFGRQGRRIAILGDMLELGKDADRLHREIADCVHMGAVDLVFACGPHSKTLYDALPRSKRGDWAENSQTLAPMVKGDIKVGDAVMVKGSLGSRMATIVAALDSLGTSRRKTK